MTHGRIKKGEIIVCKRCKEEIYRARKQIPSKAPLKSDFLEFMDGTPVPFGSKLECPLCSIRFDTINTETREMETDPYFSKH